MEITIEFDAQDIVGKLTEFGKVQLPQAAATALNQTAFEMRRTYQQEAKNIFNDPVPFTLNSFLYKKATPENLEAVVYIREDGPKGNAPSDYLAPHIYGGQAYRTRFQRGLSNTPDPSPLVWGHRSLLQIASWFLRSHHVACGLLNAATCRLGSTSRSSAP